MCEEVLVERAREVHLKQFNDKLSQNDVAVLVLSFHHSFIICH